jgi:hypothetical protein
MIVVHSPPQGRREDRARLILALCLVLLGLELTAGEPSACNLPFSGNNLKKVSNASARQRMVHLVLSQEQAGFA